MVLSREDYELRLNCVTIKASTILMKKRRYSLHKQLNQDSTQLTMWYNTVNLRNDIDETQHLFNEYLNERSDVMWQRMRNSMQHVSSLSPLPMMLII